jgi:hypothetical protein
MPKGMKGSSPTLQAVKAAAASKKYRLANLEKSKTASAIWLAANRDRVRAQKKDWERRNPGRNAEIARAWYAANTEYAKAEQKKRYTPQQMAARSQVCKLAKQERLAGRKKPKKCEVCEKSHRQICFDHCHKSKKFRGWICANCNFILGLAHDDAALLDKLAAFLRDNEDGGKRGSQKRCANKNTR